MVLSGTSDDCRSDLFEVRACRSHRDNLPFPGVGISIVRERGWASPHHADVSESF
jgi:hypothetical protein